MPRDAVTVSSPNSNRKVFPQPEKDDSGTDEDMVIVVDDRPEGEPAKGKLVDLKDRRRAAAENNNRQLR